jgi:hypothetical protein
VHDLAGFEDIDAIGDGPRGIQTLFNQKDGHYARIAQQPELW